VPRTLTFPAEPIGGEGGGDGVRENEIEDDGEYEHERRRGRVVGLVALAVSLALVCGVGYGAYSFLEDSFTDSPDAAKAPSASTEPPETSPRNAARRFLAEWAAANWKGAGELTDHPAEAAEALVNFDRGLSISERELTVGDAKPPAPDESVAVPFEARLTVDAIADWRYTGALKVAKSPAGKGYLVTWSPSTLHPALTADTRLKLTGNRAGADDSTVLRAKDGTTLSVASHPTLANIGFALLHKAQPGENAPPGGVIALVDAASGSPIRRLATVGEVPKDAPRDGGIRTTLDAKLQTAAERAMSGEERTSALAAVRISTGEILAVANTPPEGNNNAFQARTQPGSTLKIVTAATLLGKGLVSLDERVGCPESANAGGMTFTNSEGRAFPNGTFKQAFAQSCNTTMANLQGKLSGDDLSAYAHDYFGIGGDWKTGIVSFDGSVPSASTDTMKTADMIGQGEVQMNPLTMASVVATAKSGTFRQPHLLPGTDGLWTASPLPAGVSGRLRTLMRAVVTEGTAGVLSGLGGDVGAKTGTAEVGGGKPNNGWMVAYRGDVAVAVWVEGGITGGRSAGPIVKSFLAAAG